MAKLLFTALARRIIIDGKTNLVSLIDLVSNSTLQVSSLPVPAFAFFSVYSNWLREGKADRKLLVRALAVSPSGQRLEDQAVEQELISEKTHHRWSGSFEGLMLGEFGDWHIVFELKKGRKWVEMGSEQIELAPEPEQE